MQAYTDAAIAIISFELVCLLTMILIHLRAISKPAPWQVVEERHKDAA